MQHDKEIKIEIDNSKVALNVMSFNIRYGTAKDGINSWENRKEMVFDLLKQDLPDIIGMQEVLHFQLEEIKSQLPVYEHIGVGRDGQTKGEYSPILYRQDKYRVLDGGTFWLSDTPDVVGSITWGNAHTRICTWAKFQDKKTGRKFYLYNLHLDHISQLSREKSIDMLIEKTKGLAPVIIMGDLNAGEDNPAILKLIAAGLSDSYRHIHKHETEVKTYHAFTGQTQGDKIDYIFVSEKIETIDAGISHYNIDSRYPSDHFPVTAKVILNYSNNKTN